MKRTVLALAAPVLAAALASCATPTYYQAATSPTGVGYSDYQIEPGRYRITFQGGGGAPPTQVQDFALLRAAELTAGAGDDWFRIVSRDGVTLPPSSGSSLSIGGGGGSFGGGGGVGVGLGTSFDLSGGPRIARSMEILTGRNPAPPGPDVYDARAVIRDLAPRASPAAGAR